MLDVVTLRKDFPILHQTIQGRPLVYLDNAATTQKPRQVIRSLQSYYEKNNANIHRGIHTLSERATQQYEAVRQKVATFIHAKSARSIVFTRNTTESLNLIAYSWGEQVLQAGDRIVLSQLEHHSNLIPWQRLAQKMGAELCFIPVSEDGQLDLTSLADLINERTKVVSVTHMSNAFGTINDVKAIGQAAKAQGALFVVDGAQSVPHLMTDVTEIGCDFLAFSAHKMLGPTGVGVLYGKEEILEAMNPFLGGGEMISEVWYDRAQWNTIPWKFEAGTPNIADVIAFGAALDYLRSLGLEHITEHEHMLVKYTLEQLEQLEGVTLYGPRDIERRGGIVSFNLKGIHPHDIGSILDHCGIAIRAGHHCAQPLMKHYGIAGTARASFYIYNQISEIDQLVEGLKQVQEVFSRVSHR